MPIFVDEAGFTGNDLLNDEQPFFVLSSVHISDAEAQHLVEKTKKNFQLRANELKANRLLRTNNGRNAIEYILGKLQGRYALSCNHKTYNLCCKFFEYVFEPVLKEKSRIFYSNNFHLFIANTIYLFSANEDGTTSEILTGFAKMMREKDFQALRVGFSSKADPQMPKEVFKSIVDFMESYSNKIIEELDILKITGDHGKWILDLSFSSLSSLLRHWAKSESELTVICDSSKPLAAIKDSLNIMIGRTDRPQFTFPGRDPISPVFNLKESIQFKDSRKSSGIQLADILASSAVYAIKNKNEDLWHMIGEGMIEESVFPTPDNVDLTKKQPFVNGVVLQELASRARQGSDPVKGMAEYYQYVKNSYDFSPPTNTSL